MIKKRKEKIKYSKGFIIQIILVCTILVASILVIYTTGVSEHEKQLYDINSNVSKKATNMLSININLLKAFSFTANDSITYENFSKNAKYYVESFDHILYIQHKNSETITDMNYPSEPYDVTLGRSLKNRPEVEEYYKSAIRLQDIVINEPFIFDIFDNKPLGLIMRIPLYVESEFDGFFVLVTDLGKEFENLFSEYTENFEITIRDSNGNIIYGIAEAEHSISEKDFIEVQNVKWSSVVGFKNNPAVFSFSQFLLLMIIVVFSIIYLAVYYRFAVYKRKNAEILKLEKEKNKIEAGLREKQRLSALGQLSKGIAHEINNPVNGIINYSQLIIDNEKAPEENRSNAKEITELAYRVSDIAKNLLSFSGKTRKNPYKTDIKTVLKASMALFETVLAHDNIFIKIETENNLPLVKCKPHEIQQVFTHILVNAWESLSLKYPEHDIDQDISIKISIRNKEEQQWMLIEFTDNGIGIAKEIEEHIFEPFFSTKPRDKASGLGLSVSYGIIKDHGGVIRHESEEGSYAKIIVELPVYNSFEQSIDKNITEE